MATKRLYPAVSHRVSSEFESSARAIKNRPTFILVVSAKGMLVPKRTVARTIQGDRNQSRNFSAFPVRGKVSYSSGACAYHS